MPIHYYCCLSIIPQAIDKIHPATRSLARAVACGVVARSPPTRAAWLVPMEVHNPSHPGQSKLSIVGESVVDTANFNTVESNPYSMTCAKSSFPSTRTCPLSGQASTKFRNSSNEANCLFSLGLSASNNARSFYKCPRATGCRTASGICLG